ncbi:MAG: carboxypeptidase M32 [Myxococcota bacterium]
MKAYSKLEERFGRIERVSDALSLLHWDLEAMMPDGAAGARSEQLSTLKVIRHELLTEPVIEEWLEEAKDEDLDAWQSANLREIGRSYHHAASLPSDLVERQSRARSKCQMTWRRARADDDFAQLAPELAEVVDVEREVARVKGEALGMAPYDALLDAYAPGWTAEKVDVLFDELAEFLPGLIDEVLEAQAEQPRPKPPEGPFPREAQRSLAKSLMAQLGFDFERGRLDESAHAFCGGATDDVRITIDYLEEDFARSLMAVLHETGHALYEFGLPREFAYQPVGQARGMTIHESQSILVEMQVCRSRAFFEFAAPLLKESFSGSGSRWEPENLAALATQVERSLIRIDADEVTYPAHVILRYQLERQLIDGDLEVEQLPEAWNGLMDEYVGVVPPTDREGCMQDIHWVSGAFGYFPTYTLGALAAAQLFAAADRDIDALRHKITRGEFSPLVDWLEERVHRRASSVTSDALIEDATGQKLSTDAYRAHIRRRYLGEGSG